MKFSKNIFKLKFQSKNYIHRVPEDANIRDARKKCNWIIIEAVSWVVLTVCGGVCEEKQSLKKFLYAESSAQHGSKAGRVMNFKKPYLTKGDLRKEQIQS